MKTLIKKTITVTNFKNILGFILLLPLIFIVHSSWQKINTYTLTEPQALNTYNLMVVLKDVVPKSDIPINKAISILNQADSIQTTIANQYKKLNDSTSKK